MIGNQVTLHAGVIIGADGFGYTVDEKGMHTKINQIGNVVIEDNVEIGRKFLCGSGDFGNNSNQKWGLKSTTLVQGCS